MTDSGSVGAFAHSAETFTVLDLLGGALPDLSIGWPVVVEDRGDCYLLLPQAAVGQSDTRRLADLPLVPTAPVQFDADVADTVRELCANGHEYAPVARADEIIGVVSRGDMLQQLLSEVSPDGRTNAVVVLADVLEHIREGVVLLGSDREVELTNRTGRKLLPQLTGTRNLERVDVLAGVPLAELLSATAGGPARDITLENGTVISVLLLAEPRTEGDYVLMILRDVTGIRRRQAREAARDRLVTLGELAGSIAHDFNNMLTVILAHAQLLERHQPGHPSADAIHDAGQRAAGLVRQLLAFGSREVVRPVVIDMQQMLRGLDELLRRLIGENIELRFEVPDDLWRVNADPSQIERVLANLVVNARHAMPGGGHLTISARNATGEHGDQITLTVEDTGEGMPPEVLARVFEPYFTTRGEHGSGLGLATVHGTVTQLGGEIRVSSEVGVGTRFEIAVPATRAPGTTPSTERPAHVPRGSLRVLLVEDDAKVADAVVRLLKAQGHHVVSAQSEPEARAVLHGGEPVDVVVTDLVLARGSGQSLLVWLAAEHPGIRRVLTSGYAASDSSAYAHAVLPKPFTTDELAAALGQPPS